VSANGGETALEMVDITKTFPGVRALDRVTLRARRGEIHAICGENGAGKSTLMKILSGYYPVGTYEGVIRIGGVDCAFRSIRDAERAGVAIIHQELALVRELSVADNLLLGHERVRAGLDTARGDVRDGKILAGKGRPVRRRPARKRSACSASASSSSSKSPRRCRNALRSSFWTNLRRR